MAAAGNAHIGFLATAKHPDHLTHWRQGGFGWRMKNFTNGNVHDLYQFCPNRAETIHLKELPEGTLEKWLPHPTEIASWAVVRTRTHHE
jgi:hypothetical protein